jgi:hypothetical protein
LDRFGECGPLGQEPVPGVHGIGTGFLCGCDQSLN